MARGNEIIVSAHPQGVFEECVISGTPKPGTLMEIVPSTEPVNGRFTYRAFSAGDGFKGPCVVLMPDSLQGKLATDAYVTGTRGFLYWPIAGETLNIMKRYQPGTGTANIENIGDKLEVDGATGMLQAVGTGGPTGSHVSAPFYLLEHGGVADTADSLKWVKYLGNNA